MQICSSCKTISEDSAVRCEKCGVAFSKASSEFAPDASLIQIARDISVIKKVVIGWLVFSVVATILAGFVWFMESLSRQPLVSPPGTQKDAASELR
jgi:uncharacterized membrane protein YvbJ